MEIIRRKYEGEPVTLCPIGDVQLGSGGKTGDRLRRHIEWCLHHPNPLFIGMGDMVDLASPSNRQRFKAADLYDSFKDAVERQAEDYLGEVIDCLSGTEGKWLGLLEGHHFFEYMDGSTTDTRLAEYLGCPHLGTTALIDLSGVVRIYATHGSGSGVSAAAPVQRLERIAKNIEADIYLIGHMSKKALGTYDRLRVGYRGRLEHRTVMLVGTGGFAQGYEQGSKQGKVPRGSYVERGMMAPVALGAPVIIFQLIDGRPDIHASI